MSQFVETPCKTFTAGAAIAKYLRVKLTAGKLATAGSTDQELGTLEEASFADLDPRAVRLRTAQGTQKFVAVDAITLGNPFYAAASGKVSASGTVLIGIALEATTADGDILEGLRRQETSDSSAAGGTTAAAFLVDSDSAIPKIELASYVGGTGDYKVTLKPAATLTQNQIATVPDVTDTIVMLGLAQTLTNKTLTSPTVTTPTMTMKTATVAVGGTAIGNANAVNASTITAVTLADDTAAVLLPATAAGTWCEIKNTVANKILCVFPPVSSKINGGATNAVYNMAAGSMRRFFATNTTQWWTSPETIA